MVYDDMKYRIPRKAAHSYHDLSLKWFLNISANDWKNTSITHYMGFNGVKFLQNECNLPHQISKLRQKDHYTRKIFPVV